MPWLVTKLGDKCFHFIPLYNITRNAGDFALHCRINNLDYNAHIAMESDKGHSKLKFASNWYSPWNNLYVQKIQTPAYANEVCTSTNYSRDQCGTTFYTQNTSITIANSGLTFNSNIGKLNAYLNIPAIPYVNYMMIQMKFTSTTQVSTEQLPMGIFSRDGTKHWFFVLGAQGQYTAWGRYVVNNSVAQEYNFTYILGNTGIYYNIFEIPANTPIYNMWLGGSDGKERKWTLDKFWIRFGTNSPTDVDPCNDPYCVCGGDFNL